MEARSSSEGAPGTSRLSSARLPASTARRTCGDPVTGAVAGAFHGSRSTAGKRILAVRRAGLLDQMGDRR
jgi:hypothetical protein